MDRRRAGRRRASGCYQALAEARKTYDLQETVLRRALLAVCMHGQREH